MCSLVRRCIVAQDSVDGGELCDQRGWCWTTWSCGEDLHGVSVVNTGYYRGAVQ